MNNLRAVLSVLALSSSTLLNATTAPDSKTVKPTVVLSEKGASHVDPTKQPFPVITAQLVNDTQPSTKDTVLTLDAATRVLQAIHYSPSVPLGIDESFLQQYGETGATTLQGAALIAAGRESTVRGVLTDSPPSNEDAQILAEHQSREGDAKLIGHIFYVDRDLFVKNLEMRRSETLVSHDENALEVFLKLLSAAGVDCGADRLCAFNKTTGAIMMRNTAEGIERSKRLLLDLNQVADDHAIYSPPLDHRTINIHATLCKLSDAEFATLKLSEPVVRARYYWSLTSPEAARVQQQIKNKSTAVVSSVRIATSPGISATSFVGDDRKSAEFATFPYFEQQTIGMNVMARTTGYFQDAGTADWLNVGGWTNVAILNHISIPPNGTAVLRATDGKSHTGKPNNLVLFVTAATQEQP